jgi:hypothetical protein
VRLVDEVDLGPGVRAGFTTRRGGVSKPPWDGLNLGVHVGDDPGAVGSNRRRVERWAGVPVAYATQVHAAGVHRLLGPPPPGTVTIGAADALVTDRSTVALAVLVADCVPVLLADPVAGVVAVAHAGRAGLLAGVVQATVAAMVELGARPDQVRAVLGPCILGRSYEVPATLREQAASRLPEVAATTSWGTPAIDLPAGVRAALAGCEVRDVVAAGRDTYTDLALYSHRRDGPATGRFAGIIRLLPGTDG